LSKGAVASACVAGAGALLLGVLGALSRQAVPQTGAGPIDRQQHVDALMIRAASRIAHSRPAEAIVDLEDVVRLEPGRVGASIELGQAHAALDDLDAAERDLRAALDRDPQSAPLHLALGELAQLQGRPDVAEAELRRAMEVAPANHSFRIKLATFYLGMGRPERAREIEPGLIPDGAGPEPAR
jgi:Flp pilus assembly protein TadD